MKQHVLIAFACASLAVTANAQTPNTQAHKMPEDVNKADKWDVTLGLAAGLMPEFSGGNRYEAMALPFLDVTYRYNERVSFGLNPISGLTGNYKLNERFTAGAALTYRSERDSDSAIFNGMQEVDGTFEFGPYLQAALTQTVNAELGMKSDITGEHDGWLAYASLNHSKPLNERIIIGGGLSATYASEDFQDAYYSVDAAEVRTGRAQYAADGGLQSVDAHVFVMRMYDANWFTRADVIVEQLLGDAADSPLTPHNTGITSFITVGYRF